MSTSPTPPRDAQHTTTTPARNQAPLVAGAWAVVAVPLAYGLYNAVKAATQLFTG